jgi:hypothetical protein
MDFQHFYHATNDGLKTARLLCVPLAESKSSAQNPHVPLDLSQVTTCSIEDVFNQYVHVAVFTTSAASHSTSTHVTRNPIGFSNFFSLIFK